MINNGLTGNYFYYAVGSSFFDMKASTGVQTPLWASDGQDTKKPIKVAAEFGTSLASRWASSKLQTMYTNNLAQAEQSFLTAKWNLSYAKEWSEIYSHNSIARLGKQIGWAQENIRVAKEFEFLNILSQYLFEACSGITNFKLGEVIEQNTSSEEVPVMLRGVEGAEW